MNFILRSNAARGSKDMPNDDPSKEKQQESFGFGFNYLDSLSE